MALKCRGDCGLSFKAWTILECFLEVASSLLVIALAFYVWVKSGSPKSFLHDPKNYPKEGFAARNIAIEKCVILWCLSVIVAICLWRLVSTAVLFLCALKRSVLLGQLWMVYKIFVATVSFFVAISAFTVPSILIVAITSALADLLTSYYVFLLWSETEKMGKAIISENGSKKSKARHDDDDP